MANNFAGKGWGDYIQFPSSNPDDLFPNWAYCSATIFYLGNDEGTTITVKATPDTWVYVNGTFFILFFIEKCYFSLVFCEQILYGKLEVVIDTHSM